MKLLVFAHTPPPHHGQSYMLKLMLEGFGGDARRRKPSGPHPLGIECYHVNARFSRGMSDIGEFQGAKLFLVLWFCLQALWIRFRHGVRNLYYVPAPGKRVALWRDWLVMFLCRPFFDRVILHWHAAGLAKWLETETNIYARGMTWRMFRPVELSMVLSRYNIADAQKLLSRRIIVVNNGIPDPCPDFNTTLLPRRHKRLLLRQKILSGDTRHLPVQINVLFLAHCTREKGLFATIEAVRLANRLLVGRGLPMQLRLKAAGNFVTPEEEAEFHRLGREPELAGIVEHAGFVSGDPKAKLYCDADVFCFPTSYLGENQPVNLIEAMAFGVPIVTTRWRSVPEMLPSNYPGLVTGQNPQEIAETLLNVLASKSGELARAHFCNHFTLDRHLASLAAALHSVETAES